MITIPVIDWTDPCGALDLLRPLWLQAQLETSTTNNAGVTEVHFRSSNSERRVKYAPGGSTIVDLARLGRLIAMLEYQCSLSTGIPARRVTIAG